MSKKVGVKAINKTACSYETWTSMVTYLRLETYSYERIFWIQLNYNWPLYLNIVVVVFPNRLWRHINSKQKISYCFLYNQNYKFCQTKILVTKASKMSKAPGCMIQFMCVSLFCFNAFSTTNKCHYVWTIKYTFYVLLHINVLIRLEPLMKKQMTIRAPADDHQFAI